MKHIGKGGILIAATFLLIAALSCEKPGDKTDSGVFFKVGRMIEFRFNDIELYDSSTHILYFRDEHDLFTEYLEDSFAFLNDGDTLYAGKFCPAYISSIPGGPIILTPGMYGNHALRIEIWFGNKPDPRNSDEVIKLLQEHNLLHSGLSGSVDFVNINGSELSFGFTITNHDLSDLLIVDINKTGPELFHYFTNGLHLRDLDHNKIFESNIVHRKPEPWDSWKPEWLSVLKAGDSESFTINYTIENSIDPGEYNLLFEFPGLAYQVSKAQLFQDNGRIWLGDITLRDRITIP
jgi:hypothetical protein